jgi:glutathione S-transferase
MQHFGHLGHFGHLRAMSMQAKTWALGDAFTLADCSAAPALFYGNTIVPFEDTQDTLAAYLDRLMDRPSYARVLKEAEPYFELFPMERKPQIIRARTVADS